MTKKRSVLEPEFNPRRCEKDITGKNHSGKRKSGTSIVENNETGTT